MKGVIALLILSIGMPGVAFSTELGPLELEDWSTQLHSQNWQPLLLSHSQNALGMFLADPMASDLTATQTTLADCGIKLVTRLRRQFKSPPVPRQIQISTEVSRTMVQSLKPIFSVEEAERLVIQIENPRWIRLMSSDTTDLIHSSAIWSNPATRGSIVKCVSDRAARPLVESILQADIEVSVKNRRGGNIKIDDAIKAVGQMSILSDSLASRHRSYSILGVTLARRVGICVNSLLYFRNPEGAVGAESCPKVNPSEAGNK
jgi:hypothetical protein